MRDAAAKSSTSSLHVVIERSNSGKALCVPHRLKESYVYDNLLFVPEA